MSTFKNGVYFKDISFEYQAGSVLTNNAWTKPKADILNKFVKTIQEIHNYGKYELFLVGGVVNGNIEHTWDIDIIVCGDMIPSEFEQLLHNIYDIALNKFNILVDVRWFNVPIVRFNQLLEEKKVERVKTIRFGYFRKKIGDEESIIDLFEKGKKVTKYLVELEVIIPSIKAFKYKNGNKYIKI